MNELRRLIWCGLIGFFRSRASLEAEILVLRHQLNVLWRKSAKRPTFGNIDRLIFAGLYGLAPNVRSALGGRPMLKFYYSGAPNPTKVALFLEETGTPYDPIPIDTRKGDQHKPEFLAINPNAKLPAIVDGEVKVFDSSAILLYLAEKTGKFLPAKTDKARSELLSWMFFVSSGVGPYFGQSVHFRVFAPEKISYATNRYAFEAQRHADILDTRLAKQKYMLGDTYTIVDMNVWGWARLIPTVLGDGAWEKLPNLKRLVDEITARPAAQRAMALKDRHKFKTEMDAEAMQAMFPHLNVKVA